MAGLTHTSVRKNGFSGCSLEESQSVTRAVGQDGQCQESTMARRQALKAVGAEVTVVWCKVFSFPELEHLDSCPKQSQANDNSSRFGK